MSLNEEYLKTRRAELAQSIETIQGEIAKIDELRQQSLANMQLLTGAVQMIDELLAEASGAATSD